MNQMTKPQPIDECLFNFICEKFEEKKHPLVIKELHQQFFNSSESERNTREPLWYFYRRIRILSSRVSTLENVDVSTKAKFYFAVGAHVPDHFLKILEKNGSLFVDYKNRIIKYESNDGNLKLERDRPKIPRSWRSTAKSIDKQRSKIINKISIIDGPIALEAIAMSTNGNQGYNGTLFETSSISTSSPTIDKTIPLLNAEKNTGNSDDGIAYYQESDIILEEPEDPVLPQFSMKRESEVIKEPTLVTINNVNVKQESQLRRMDSEQNVQQPENTTEMADTVDFLMFLKSTIRTLDSPLFADILIRIDEKTAVLKAKDRNDIVRKFPIRNICNTLDTIIFIVTKCETVNANSNESISMKEFLLLLQSILFNLNCSALDGAHQKMKQIYKECSEKMVSLSRIRLGLEIFFEIST